MTQPNLLVSLYKWAVRQQENYTTDAFAHLIQMLCCQCPQVAQELMSWLAHLPAGALPIPSEADWNLRTQQNLACQGIPDLRLQAGDCDIIVEVKLGGDNCPEQLSCYRDILEETNVYRHRKLVSLTGRNPYQTDGTVHCVHRLWHEVGTWLQERIDDGTVDPVTHPVCAHLARDFIGLLRHLHIAAIPIRSPLSEGLQKHRDNFDPKAGKSPFHHRLKSLRHLDPFEDLHPLRDLFATVVQILDGFSELLSVRVDSSAGSWFGVLMNNLDWICYVWLDEPDVLWFERWNGNAGVDPRSFDEKRGKVYESQKAHRWKVQLDLAESFYKSGPIRQRDILENFLRESLEYSKSLGRGPDRGSSASGPAQDVYDPRAEDPEPPPL